MEQSKRIKFKRLAYGGIKLLIAVAAFVFIYNRVISRENFLNMLREYPKIFETAGSLFAISMIVVLMLLNWSLEALKWKFMMRKLEVIPPGRALAAVFSGLTVSFFTPNRMGEYAGRIFHLRTADRIQGTFVTILENISQLIITILVGSISLIFYLGSYTGLHAYILWAISVLMVIFSGTILLLFLEVPVLDKSVLKIERIKKLSPYLEILSGYRKSELMILLGLALLRYIVFTTQFLMLLKVFGIASDYGITILLINMTFFVMTVVPTFALTEVGVRGAVATYFFSRISYDSLAILNATLSLWIINLVIPALVGIIFIFQFRFSRDKQ